MSAPLYLVVRREPSGAFQVGWIGHAVNWVLILVAVSGLPEPPIIEHFPSEAACVYAAERTSQLARWDRDFIWECYDKDEVVQGE